MNPILNILLALIVFKSKTKAIVWQHQLQQQQHPNSFEIFANDFDLKLALLNNRQQYESIWILFDKIECECEWIRREFLISIWNLKIKKRSSKFDDEKNSIGWNEWCGRWWRINERPKKTIGKQTTVIVNPPPQKKKMNFRSFLISFSFEFQIISKRFF